MTTLATEDRMQCMEVWGGNSSIERRFHVPGLDVWIRSRPYEQSHEGGDVYYVSSCASGRITRLLLADVSGHGQGVADIAVNLRNLMRKHVNLINQTRFVRELNRQFSKDSPSERFATALVCTYFAPTRSLQLCNAGHPFPIIFRQQDQQWCSAASMAHAIRGDGLVDVPLGVVDGAEYSRFDTKLARGDMVLCVSDAFIEAMNGEGEMLGIDGWTQLVQTIDGNHPEEVIPQLVNQIQTMHPGNLEQDDATIILFRANGSVPSVKDNLMAPLRFVRGVRDSVRP